MSRDKELDEVQRELERPYIEKPDEIDPQEGALCFLDKARLCNGSCTAYLGDDHPTPAERCLVLRSGFEALVILRNQARQIPAAPSYTPPNYGGK